MLVGAQWKSRIIWDTGSFLKTLPQEQPGGWGFLEGDISEKNALCPTIYFKNPHSPAYRCQKTKVT
jgi:hypothetical protein